MKLLLIALIVCALLNAETIPEDNCDSVLADCSQSVAELEQAVISLQVDLEDTKKEKDQAFLKLAAADPPLLPSYVYAGGGFVAGIVAVLVFVLAAKK